MYNQYERETIITTHDGLKTINVYTYHRKWMNKILLLKEKNPDEVNIIKQNEYMIEADLPAKYPALDIEEFDDVTSVKRTNFVVVKQGNESSDKVKALIKAINSDAVKKYIEDKYKGAVISSFVDPQ